MLDENMLGQFDTALAPVCHPIVLLRPLVSMHVPLCFSIPSMCCKSCLSSNIFTLLGVFQVRSMKDNFGDKVAATPSTAVQMSGLHVVPVAGDDFIVAKTLDEVC